MAGGRPTTYKPEYCETVLRLGAEGASVVEMCAEIGVDRNTLERDWPSQFEEFSQSLSKARLSAQSWWEKTGRIGMFESPGGVKLNQGIWSRSMAARFPHDWRENSKVENTHAGPDGGPVTVSVAVAYVDPPKD